jgi:hypothetical protein
MWLRGGLTLVTRELHPKLGREGATTWKFGPSLLSLRRGRSLVTSMKLPGPEEFFKSAMSYFQDSAWVVGGHLHP